MYPPFFNTKWEIVRSSWDQYYYIDILYTDIVP